MEITGTEILLAINALLMGLAFLFVRQWVVEKTAQLAELFEIGRTLRTIENCKEHRARVQKDIEILRSRQNDHAESIVRRVEIDYCRQCVKRDDHG